MSHAEALRNNFDTFTLKKAAKFLESHSLIINYVTDSYIEANFISDGAHSSLQTVFLESDESQVIEEVGGACSCRAFKKIQGCEHIMALAYLSEKSSFLSGKKIVRFLEFRPSKRAMSEQRETDFLWQGQVQELRESLFKKEKQVGQTLKESIWFALDPLRSGDSPSLYFFKRERLKSGDWGKAKKISLNHYKIELYCSEFEQRAFNLLFGGISLEKQKLESFSSVVVHRDIAPQVFSLLSVDQKLTLLNDDNVFDDSFLPLLWSPSKSVREKIEIEIEGEGEHRVCILRQSFFLDDGDKREKIADSAITPFFMGGVCLIDQELIPLENSGAIKFSKSFFKIKNIRVPWNERRYFVELLKEAASFFSSSVLEVPEELELPVKVIRPEPMVEINLIKRDENFCFYGKLYFRYQGEIHLLAEKRPLSLDSSSSSLLVKDFLYEQSILQKVVKIDGVKELADGNFTISPDQFYFVIKALERLGVESRAFGKEVRAAQVVEVDVVRKVNWFEVRSYVKVGNTQLSAPDILQRFQQDKNFFTLDAKTLGVVPDQWPERMKLLTDLGTTSKGVTRLHHAHATSFKDLFKESVFTCDDSFEKLLKTYDKVKNFKIIKPAKQFQGSLRPYQSIGLSWMKHIEQMGVGGCLADEMGLGKTIQALSYIQKRKQTKEGAFLVVVPKSLIGNWMEEAKKFTPNLVVRHYNGSEKERTELLDKIGSLDILIITYGLLRSDIDRIQKFYFDGVILDEAQNIKNAKSQTAKAAYQLKSDVRLAMTGTPIENHIGELLSIFNFLAPGFFKKAMLYSRVLSQEATENVMKSLRPFILRRTKSEVLKDLPEKTESLIYCDFSKEQYQEYVQMTRFFAGELSKKLTSLNSNKSKFHALEGLLRLRQYACDPRLIDRHSLSVSPKIETLLSHLREIKENGQKALIFSQFTSFLQLLSAHLKSSKITYCYLDGQTQNRQEEIDRFNNEDATAFLISLKAGGVGLNLTAASYCFILDPWWNPAVENQAIDRIHRIGQKQKVFVYRLITRDSIEQKVMELQSHKKDLEKDLLSSEKSFLSRLSHTEILSLFN